MPRRLIEEAFPLKKVSADSKHEKNVRHGHISTLHIWPARRPLAACRAVTIATLLPDPADAPKKMKAEYTRLSGSPLPDKQRDYLCNTLIASLTRWGDENGHADWGAKDQNGRWLNKLRIARELILMAYNGDPPKVLDMFAGGGAIRLEAMRLGCEVIANDYNPVAWFILKCTLEYPQRLAGKTAPLPKLELSEQPDLKNGDLADHVRLWGQWVLENARKDLADYYPVIDNKPTVAYLWARTVPCQDPQCGATVPLLKTLWVCKKAEKTLKDTPDLSDFFFVWLRRTIGKQFFGISSEPLTPKISELVQHTGRFEGNNDKARKFYENGMAKSFQSAYKTLSEDGRMVVVFAHKAPEAWETLVKAMIESSLVVTTSWPIDTEQGGRMRAQGSAALATSLWMVCRKRPTNPKTGHYAKVKREMQKRITERLRYFWDEGIRGPDFVWAAIGPALESYSSHKEVKRMDGQIFTVTEFLTEVRRMVTDFALGQILHGTSTEALDEWTRYYLMHKDYFRTENAPVGECILLAQGYGVPLDDLRDRHIGILKKASSGNALKLLGHTERTSDRIGYPHTSGRTPMIDMIHKVMKLWDAGEREQINAYFHEHGLQENPLFKAVVQALIETSPQGSSDGSLLEALINYEPGEFSGIASSRRPTNQTEQQLTLEEILSK